MGRTIFLIISWYDPDTDMKDMKNCQECPVTVIIKITKSIKPHKKVLDMKMSIKLINVDLLRDITIKKNKLCQALS